MTRSRYDIAIIGGGPAGAAASIAAARLGARVLLLERGRYPRQKVCGEFISSEALGLLQTLLRDAPDALAELGRAPRIDCAHVYLGAKSFSARIDPPATSFARHDLDARLWRAAESAGVEARQAVEVTMVRRSSDVHEGAAEERGNFLVETTSEVVAADAVIDSSGRGSRLAAKDPHNGRAGARAKWIGLKAHFSSEAPLEPATELYCFAGGYCGVQPVRCGGATLVNVCALVRADAARRLEEVFLADAKLYAASRAWQQATETSVTGAISFRAPHTERDGVLLAGDAAGFIDPFVGDGIAIALRGGAMAGEIAARAATGRIRHDEALAEYARQYHAAFDRGFRNARRLRRMLEAPAAARSVLLRLARIPGAAEMMVRSTRSG